MMFVYPDLFNVSLLFFTNEDLKSCTFLYIWSILPVLILKTHIFNIYSASALEAEMVCKKCNRVEEESEELRFGH